MIVSCAGNPKAKWVTGILVKWVQCHSHILHLPMKHTHGLECQPPVQYEHEVVTGDGEVDTLLQTTR